MSSCSVEDCEKAVKARGWCAMHYFRWKRTGSLGLTERMPRTCDAADCDRPHAGHGYCFMHLERWKKHGDPSFGARKRSGPTCDAPGCDKLTPGRSYCPMHYDRLKRNGHLERQTRVRHSHSMGYVFVKAAGHPLANSKGWAYEHRLVLFAKIGPGDHPCHWCGMTVSWDLSYPDHQGALVSDHLDDDRSNNNPSNLVPSCAVCNLKRSDPLGKRYGKATR